MENINWGRSLQSNKIDQEQFKLFTGQTSEELYNSCLNKDGELFHIIKSEHFDLKFLNKIFTTAKIIKNNYNGQPKWINSLLTNYSILNYFAQPSSRTFLSFSSAEALLGIRREELRSLETSSMVKGESDKDSLRTISSYFDAIVCRHPSNLFDLFSVWVMKESDREIPIINAGSGTSEHPTQALLDYYTIRESFTEIKNLHIGFVGDCLRGRTVHSLSKVMSLYPNTKMSFIAPKEIQLDEDTKTYLKKKGINFQLVTSPLKEIVSNLDIIYMTRIQDEHGGNGTTSEHFKFNLEDLNDMKKNAILMHPMPKRDEIDPRIDYLSRDPRVMYWRQQRNGMWVRAALLLHLFQRSDCIKDIS